ncbi:tRNA (adenine(22)-N(1))-methyltransferase [Chungangia koreensis]|uniref:tRNA (Adenine(22)-N(1))-methyltransferase n=1 Tax=Chungangia koreensis TaxID=752657 RepID=A0ABV8X9P4_9LACT
MNSQKLSKRLETVASYVPKGSRLADIGSDHAYLPCYLAHQGMIDRAIAGEVVKGPYESAVKEVKKEGLQNSIVVRLADGLDAIRESDQIDTITIAGMGGPLIVSIIEKGKTKLTNVQRLILQPNVHAKAIREWAVNNEWKLIDEKILKEDRKIYEVLVLERGTVNYSDVETLMGPFLLKDKNLIFLEKWNSEVNQWRRIVDSLNLATEDQTMRKEELEKLISLVEGEIGQ